MNTKRTRESKMWLKGKSLLKKTAFSKSCWWRCFSILCFWRKIFLNRKKLWDDFNLDWQNFIDFYILDWLLYGATKINTIFMFDSDVRLVIVKFDHVGWNMVKNNVPKTVWKVAVKKRFFAKIGKVNSIFTLLFNLKRFSFYLFVDQNRQIIFPYLTYVSWLDFYEIRWPYITLCKFLWDWK